MPHGWITDSRFCGCAEGRGPLTTLTTALEESHAKLLEAELQGAVEALAKEHRQRTNSLHANASQQRSQWRSQL